MGKIAFIILILIAAVMLSFIPLPKFITTFFALIVGFVAGFYACTTVPD